MGFGEMDRLKKKSKGYGLKYGFVERIYRKKLLIPIVSTACAHRSEECRHQDFQNLDRKKEGDRPPNPRNGDKLETARRITKLLKQQKFEEIEVSCLSLGSAILVPLILNSRTH